MLALAVGTLAFWLLVSLLASLAVLAGVLGIAAALGRRASRGLVTRLAVGVGAAALIAPLAVVVVYTQLINDPEPRFDRTDLADLVSGGGEPTGSTTGMLLGAPALATSSTRSAPDDTLADDAECAASSASPSSSLASSPAGDGELDGEWVVAEGSEVGYRIPEQLAGVDTEAVGRGTDIAGSFTVADAEVTEACIVVEVASITSDESMRDGQFRGRIMQTDQYPTATFAVTEPIAVDQLPEVGGDPITVTVTGDLTLRGVTNEVTFEAQVQAGDAGIGVLGAIPVVFADYDIPDPSGGPARVGDEGTLELLVLFARD